MEFPPPLQLAFIGGGLLSAIGQTHFSASRMDGRWLLTAGAFSEFPDINRKTGDFWHVPEDRAYDDWRDLVKYEKDAVDAVVVLTPTPHHVKVLPALLDAGMAVICEKSMVASVEEATKVRRHYKPGDSFLAVTFNYSGYPLVRELRRRVEIGELGKIQQIHLEMPQEGFVRPPDIGGKPALPQAWRLQDGSIPTVCLDLGVHLHHLVTFVTGLEPRQVMASFGNYSEYEGLIDMAMMMMRYDDDVMGSFWFTKTAIGNRNGLRLRVFGTEGSAEWTQVFPEELYINRIDGGRCVIDRGGRHEISSERRYNRMKAGHPAGFVEAFANLYADIADALIGHRENGGTSHPYVYGLDHAARGLNLFSAALRSHETGEWIYLD